MKYINSQKYDWDCGVIAALNGLKWLGLNYTWNDYEDIQESLQCDQDGTDPEMMSRIFEDYESVKKEKPTWQFLKEWCRDENKAAIISFQEKDGEEHLAFYDGKKCPNHCLNKKSELEDRFGEKEYCLLLFK